MYNQIALNNERYCTLESTTYKCVLQWRVGARRVIAIDGEGDADCGTDGALFSRLLVRRYQSCLCGGRSTLLEHVERWRSRRFGKRETIGDVAFAGRVVRRDGAFAMSTRLVCGEQLLDRRLSEVGDRVAETSVRPEQSCIAHICMNMTEP